jgi:hypothetical protein
MYELSEVYDEAEYDSFVIGAYAQGAGGNGGWLVDPSNIARPSE